MLWMNLSGPQCLEKTFKSTASLEMQVSLLPKGPEIAVYYLQVKFLSWLATALCECIPGSGSFPPGNPRGACQGNDCTARVDIIVISAGDGGDDPCSGPMTIVFPILFSSESELSLSLI